MTAGRPESLNLAERAALADTADLSFAAGTSPSFLRFPADSLSDSDAATNRKPICAVSDSEPCSSFARRRRAEIDLRLELHRRLAVPASSPPIRGRSSLSAS